MNLKRPAVEGGMMSENSKKPSGKNVFRHHALEDNRTSGALNFSEGSKTSFCKKRKTMFLSYF